MSNIKINVVTRLQDNGDGGYTMYVYNNNDELIADHPLSEEWDAKKKKIVKIKISDEIREEILSGEDEHENGYIGQDVIELKIVDGKYSLAKPLRFGAGQ